MIELRPITLREAKAFVAKHHRHNFAPVGWKIGVSAWVDNEMVGVGVLSRPVARVMSADTIEITRCCTNGYPNACSKIYGALTRAASALGYKRVVTYTLANEPGASLLATGFYPEAQVRDREWSSPSRPRQSGTTPRGIKVRWAKAV